MLKAGVRVQTRRLRLWALSQGKSMSSVLEADSRSVMCILGAEPF